MLIFQPGQCQYERLAEDFVEIAAEYDIPVERIHLEITESEFQDPQAVERTLDRLRKFGMQVALDRFRNRLFYSFEYFGAANRLCKD